MQPEVTDLTRYLEPSEVVDWRSFEIVALVQELTDGLESDVDRARKLYEWVRDEIPHSKDVGHEIVTCRASEVLRQRTGICFAKSHLLAAMLRAVGIPAGFCYQVLRKDPPSHGWEVHGLNGIFLSSVARWIRLDARGNTGAINAQFRLDQEQLAFPVDPTRGEYTDETIYAEPLPVVINCLRRFTTRKQKMTWTATSIEPERDGPCGYSPETARQSACFTRVFPKVRINSASRNARCN